VNRTLLAHLTLLTSMIIYAAGFTIIKKVTPEFITPAGFVAIRVLGATPLLWLTGLFLKEKVEKADLKKIAILSLFGVSINQSMFIKGMALTSSISGAIIMITSPLIVLMIGAFILKEKLTSIRITGILLGLIGAGLMILSSTLSNGKEDNALGDLFIFINAVSWGTFLAFVKPLMMKYNTVTVLKWVFLFGLPILVPLGWTGMMDAQWSTFTGETWFDIAFVVLGVTFIAYLLNVFSLKILSPTVVSAYIYTQPVFAAAIALYLGKDHLTWIKVALGLLIFSGVFLASKDTTRKSIP
jgi:drug/metabolite transporter (DMT)-like permease